MYHHVVPRTGATEKQLQHCLQSGSKIVLWVYMNTLTCLRAHHVTRSPRSFVRLAPLISVRIPLCKAWLAWRGSSKRHGSTHNKVAAKKRNPKEEKKSLTSHFSRRTVQHSGRVIRMSSDLPSNKTSMNQCRRSLRPRLL
jgi:hypothetical protein